MSVDEEVLEADRADFDSLQKDMNEYFVRNRASPALAMYRYGHMFTSYCNASLSPRLIFRNAVLQPRLRTISGLALFVPFTFRLSFEDRFKG